MSLATFHSWRTGEPSGYDALRHYPSARLERVVGGGQLGNKIFVPP